MPLATGPVAQMGSPSGNWWLTSGDPVLASLVTQGLAVSAPLTCEAAALVGIRNARHPRITLGEASYDYVDHRAHVAATIAKTYVDVRKWQALLSLRTRVVAQNRDNAEIARFRYEAGLVAAIDGGLAGAVSALNNDAQDRTRARLDADLVLLSTLTGISSDDLKAQLGAAVPIPDLEPLPAVSSLSLPDFSARADLLALKAHLEHRLGRAKITQASLDGTLAQPIANPEASPQAEHARQISPAQHVVAAWRHALATATTEISTLTATVALTDAELQVLPRRAALAQRTVADARMAYRAGAGDFATLFVAEVTALGMQEALVEARADRAGAMIDLRTARGEGWQPADLTPAAVTAAAAREGVDCE